MNQAAVAIKRYPTRLHLRCRGCAHEAQLAIFLSEVQRLRCSRDADRVEETFEQQIDRFKRPRAPGALDDPYNDPDFIDFGINPTSTVYASS
jgi:hypothetical protein